MKPQLITITPTEAKKYLSVNINNRYIKPQRVAMYAADMINGKWLVNGECIKISSENVILDGQHRLLACIESNIPFKTYVLNDLDPNVMPTIDQGVARTPGDIMHLYGIKNSVGIASSVKRYLWLKQGATSYQRKKSSFELLDEYNSRPEYWQEYFHKAKAINEDINNVITVTTLTAYLAFLSEYGDIETFFDLMTKFHNTPSALLLKVVTRARVARKKMPTNEFHVIIIKAFNAFITGKILVQLYYRVGELAPKIVSL